MKNPGKDTANVTMAGQTETKRTILKKVPLGIVESSKCEQALRSTRLGWRFRLDHTFICAGGVDGIDTCQVTNPIVFIFFLYHLLQSI